MRSQCVIKGKESGMLFEMIKPHEKKNKEQANQRSECQEKGFMLLIAKTSWDHGLSILHNYVAFSFPLLISFFTYKKETKIAV